MKAPIMNTQILIPQVENTAVVKCLDGQHDSISNLPRDGTQTSGNDDPETTLTHDIG